MLLVFQGKLSGLEVGNYAIGSAKVFISTKLNYISRHVMLVLIVKGIFISVFSS